MSLPTPKYEIGQTVYYADTERKTETLPCPDCLDTKVWIVETPAGDRLEVPCQRCCGGASYSRQDDITPLSYQVSSPVARAFVIANIEARTSGFNGTGEPEITYWSASNGGRNETSLYATESEALLLARLKAAETNEAEAKTPERLKAANIGKLKLQDARFDEFKNGLWNAWYAYRSVIERVGEYIDGREGLSARELDDFRSDMRWEIEYREKQDRPLDRLVDAVAAALSGDDSQLAEAYDALPAALRPNAPECPQETGE